MKCWWHGGKDGGGDGGTVAQLPAVGLNVYVHSEFAPGSPELCVTVFTGGPFGRPWGRDGGPEMRSVPFATGGSGLVLGHSAPGRALGKVAVCHQKRAPNRPRPCWHFDPGPAAPGVRKERQRLHPAEALRPRSWSLRRRCPALGSCRVCEEAPVPRVSATLWGRGPVPALCRRGSGGPGRPRSPTG